MGDNQAEREGLERLETEERLKGLPPRQLLELSNLGPDGTVVDIGAGGGYFSFPAAAMTRGTVYAVDASAFMLEVLSQRAAGRDLSNVQVLKGSAEKLPLDSGVADLAVASLLLHIMESPEDAIGEIRRVLKPGGQGLVVEWLHPRSDGRPGHRIYPEAMIRYLELGDLTVIRMDKWEDTYYSVLFQKV
ncbi:class I SAM-dependent methyltransferase [Paenibacillus sp. HN-1]|uniref:class I SAM-dependent methyltransferase n=1 Tax=Paenibacillus TaxID=44249 RepID=UPI001CA96CFA|nr:MULTISPECIES: class I SAM-dependent methyltransferase [Paenibacillus]MBY9077141.1 class I SAM-dependent methyltransferase [Paenibacillus sp. CGMCC 1.18879]MBY9087388.1 class I SAM-dependent methyltransferase [Paenibacillus sinensis]